MNHLGYWINHFWSVTFRKPVDSIQRCLYEVAIPNARLHNLCGSNFTIPYYLASQVFRHFSLISSDKARKEILFEYSHDCMKNASIVLCRALGDEGFPYRGLKTSYSMSRLPVSGLPGGGLIKYLPFTPSVNLSARVKDCSMSTE